MIEMQIVKGQSILYRDSTKEYAVVGNAILPTGKAFYINVTVISIKKREKENYYDKRETY